MQTRSRFLRRAVATRIVGFILIGESIALPTWMLVKGSLHFDPQTTVTRISCGESSMDIIPVTIYDGPLPATSVSTKGKGNGLPDCPVITGPTAVSH